MERFKELLQGEVPLLVDFYASWCGPCAQMEPIIAQFAERMKHRTNVLRIDIDDPSMEAVVHRYHVVSVPTLMFFRRGEVMWRESGSVSYHHLVTILEELEEYELAGQR